MGELIGSFLPLLIILVMAILGYRLMMKDYRGHVEEVNSVNQQIVDTNRAMIAELKEIKQILKDQK